MSTVAMMMATKAVVPLGPQAVIGFSLSSFTPMVYAYLWTDTGWSTRFANSSMINGGAPGTCISHVNKNAIFLANQTSPYIRAQIWSNTTGFGTEYGAPAILPNASVSGISCHPSGVSVSCSFSGGAICNVYAWSPATGFGSKYSDPVTPATEGMGCDFSPDGQTILIGQSAYQWNNSTGFGSRYNLPTGIAGSLISGHWSPDGSVVIFTTNTSPYVYAYPWSNVSGFGALYANPSTLPTSAAAVSGQASRFNPSGNSFLYAGTSSPFYRAYKWSNVTGWGSTLTVPTLSEVLNGTSFSADGTVLYTPNGMTSPFIKAFPWSDATGSGTQFTNPSPLPSGTYTLGTVFVPG